MQDLRRHPIEDRTLRLIDTILNKEKKQNAVGTDQGCSWSPNGMNVILHHRLDGPLTADPDRRRHFRFADNLGGLTRGSPESRHSIQEAKELLAQIELKAHKITTANLRNGIPATVLGLRMRLRRGKVHFETTKTTWKDLDETLRETWRSETPARNARAAIRGLIGYIGPALENGPNDLPHRLMTMANQAGHHEITPGQIQTWCEQSRERWTQFKDEREKSQTVQAVGARSPTVQIFESTQMRGVGAMDGSIGLDDSPWQYPRTRQASRDVANL
jgi:hypothetical protein